MKSTGGKTGEPKLDSLALSVDRLVVPSPSASNADITPPPNVPKDSYAKRLAREHDKVLGSPNHEDSELLKRFIEPPNVSVLMLKTAQILETKLSQKQQWEAGANNKKPTLEVPAHPQEMPVEQPASKETRVAKAKTAPIAEEPKNQGSGPKSPTKVVAPRATPFSEDAYVKVKVIVQDIDLNIGHIGTARSESITWMQRDAIKHYLTIQDIERRRAAMEGAVYRTVQYDA